jgi:hypothetical protein
MENGKDKTNSNGRGRPNKPRQLDIESNLRIPFQSGKSTYQAAIETGYNINTVKKYYAQFYKEIKDLEGTEFAQACKDRKISTGFVIDTQISKMEKLQEELEKKASTDKIPYIQLCKLRINLSNLISDLHMKKLNIANSPTYDEILTALRDAGEQK